MHTAGIEWAAQVAARNEIEKAKAARLVQGQFLWSCGAGTGRDGTAPQDTAALSATGKEEE